MSGTPEVVTCGEAMLLLLAEPGVPLARARRFGSSVAGAESNVAIGLARLGHSVRWIGSVGSDPAGDAVLSMMRAEGVDVSTVAVHPTAPTGLLLRDSHATRGIDVQYHRAGSAASALAPESVHAPLPSGTRLLHLTGITAMLSDSTHRLTRHLIDTARDEGVMVSFDPNVRHKLGAPDRWRTVVGPLLGQADLVLAGADELEMLTGQDAERAVRTLRDGGVEGVVVKYPDKSTVLTNAAGTWARPAFPVPVTDPVGAGDAFAAGLLSALLREVPPDRALAEAATVAALVVQSATDIDGLPTSAQLARALAHLAGHSDPVYR
ncbi:sugar kinase [Actinoallomurus sp. CA-142502]|uniref:sugar kinase n=1 Tax=Actinoallomurus sp. CA-142502 TaxID=3239885 RepID=UPI003D8C0098